MSGADSSVVPPPVTCSNVPTTLVSPFWSQGPGVLQQAHDIAVVGSEVYFTLGTYGQPSSLWSVPAAGGAAVRVTTLPGEEDAMVATSTTLVLAVSSEGKSASLLRIPIDGSPMATLTPTDGMVTSLLSDGVDVFFEDSEGAKSVPLGGGKPQLLALESGTLGLAGSNLLVADSSASAILSVPKAGGAATTVATNQPGVEFPTACGADLCWFNQYRCGGVPMGEVCVATQGAGALVRMPAGGSPVMSSQDPLLYPAGAVVFDGSAFFVLDVHDASLDEGLARVSADGAQSVSLGGANGIAVSGGCLFVIDFIQGVYSVATSYTP
jgi:hypothetical protein